MKSITQKRYVISYKELQQKFKIKEDIDYVISSIPVADADTFAESYGIEVGVK